MKPVGIDDFLDFGAAGAAIGTGLYRLSHGFDGMTAVFDGRADLIDTDTEAGAKRCAAIDRSGTGTAGKKRKPRAPICKYRCQSIHRPIAGNGDRRGRDEQRTDEPIVCEGCKAMLMLAPILIGYHAVTVCLTEQRSGKRRPIA